MLRQTHSAQTHAHKHALNPDLIIVMIASFVTNINLFIFFCDSELHSFQAIGGNY